MLNVIHVIVFRFSLIEDSPATTNPLVLVATCSETIGPDLAHWIYESRSVGDGINLPSLSMIIHDHPLIIPWLSHLHTPIVGKFHAGQCSIYAGVTGGPAALITHRVYVCICDILQMHRTYITSLYIHMYIIYIYIYIYICMYCIDMIDYIK